MLTLGLATPAGCAQSDAFELDPHGWDAADSGNPSQPSSESPSAQSPTTQAPTTPGIQGLTDCAQAVVADPAVDMTGITLFQPEVKQDNPRAGQPSYVYLAAGREGVILPGPTVTSADGLMTLESSAMVMVGLRNTSADGYDVVVNSSLQYRVAIRDFEFEVALARVELCVQDGELRSVFVFKGNAGASGVAHDITITPNTAAKVTALPSPVTVEVR